MTVPATSFLQLLSEASDADAPRIAVDVMNRIEEDAEFRASTLAELMGDVDLDDYNEPKDLVLFCLTEALLGREQRPVPTWAVNGLADVLADLHDTDHPVIRTLRQNAMLGQHLQSAVLPEEVPVQEASEAEAGCDHGHEHVLGGEGGSA
jgi:hypothetical protein